MDETISIKEKEVQVNHSKYGWSNRGAVNHLRTTHTFTLTPWKCKSPRTKVKSWLTVPHTPQSTARKHKQDDNQHIWIITVHLFTTDKDTSSQIHTDVFDTKLKHKWSKKLITVLMRYNMFWCLFISRRRSYHRNHDTRSTVSSQANEKR